MESSFAHKKVVERYEKWTYTQSYPHYPQKKLERGGKNQNECSV